MDTTAILRFLSLFYIVLTHCKIHLFTRDKLHINPPFFAKIQNDIYKLKS